MKAKPFTFQKGLTIIEVLVVIFVLLVLAGVVFWPKSMRNWIEAGHTSCVNNVKQVALSFKVWSVDNSDRYPMQVSTAEGGSMEFVASGYTFPHFQVMSNEIATPKFLRCPVDNRKSATNFQNDFTDSKISYFIGVDASVTNPASFLIGDSHLAIRGEPVKPGLLLLSANASVGWTSARHDGKGNIALADGSVQQSDSPGLRKMLTEIGHSTNWITIP
jgi:prepilin-type N-terminal cleavage/methylation domain-containing protein/prepilin-type processing-associated H-X9-DG protein